MIRRSIYIQSYTKLDRKTIFHNPSGRGSMVGLGLHHTVWSSGFWVFIRQQDYVFINQEHYIQNSEMIQALKRKVIGVELTKRRNREQNLHTKI